MTAPYTDPRRCEGLKSAISGRPQPPCMVYSFRNVPPGMSVQWITPLAVRDADGVWACATRDSHE